MHINSSINLAPHRDSVNASLSNVEISEKSFKNVLTEVHTRAQPTARQDTNIDRTQEREYMLRVAKENPQEADKLAYGYAHNSLGHALLDLSDRPNIRYAATGELVTVQSQNYFHSVGQDMQQQLSSLYQQEINKGTPSYLILEKIFTFQDSMPQKFKDMLAM